MVKQKKGGEGQGADETTGRPGFQKKRPCSSEAIAEAYGIGVIALIQPAQKSSGPGTVMEAID
jgi:hypothetical protein